MKRKSVLIFLILIAVIFAGYLTIYNYFLPKISGEKVSLVNIVIPRREVVGFLPYWLVSRAQNDYSKYITTLTYFSLTVAGDGTIQKYTNPGESEPGYLALTSGKIDPFINSAKEKKVKLSLAVFSVDDETINNLLADPEASAKNLVEAVTPIMENYGFTDLNLDIEQTQDASPAARVKFTRFVQAVKSNLDPKKVKSLSIDITAFAFVKETNLSDPAILASLVDKVILMAYDYHYIGSYVTGPVAPGEGAGVVSEFDTQAAVEAALKIMPAKKLILGIPLYGYGWEAIGNVPRSAIIPGTGFIISNVRAETLLADCATCSAQFDQIDKESHFIYEDQTTKTYYQIFYPDKAAIQYKTELAKQNSLGGIALWALGYEGETILEPLSAYHN
ncbi:MAG: glycosyl hydrolase family 18 protein [Candidatus Beckwithbacteria bacterium]|nr:glycosyl hydrolase family 18 protein [Candidatus Beckwithbacteria bacterium]